MSIQIAWIVINRQTHIITHVIHSTNKSCIAIQFQITNSTKPYTREQGKLPPTFTHPIHYNYPISPPYQNKGLLLALQNPHERPFLNLCYKFELHLHKHNAISIYLILLSLRLRNRKFNNNLKLTYSIPNAR